MSATEPSQRLVDDVDDVVDYRTVRAMRRWQRDEFRHAGFRTDYSDRLDEISVPTLVVHGREDPLLPRQWSKRAGESLGDGRVEIFEECGHCPPRERPDRFNRVIRAFC